MLQPKVYIKEFNIVREVEMIDFYNKQVLAYVIGVRPRGKTAIYSFDEVEFIENTGMKDKNGNDIYVGNIVKFHHPHLKNVDEIFIVRKCDFYKKYIISTLFDYSFDLNEDTIKFVEIVYNMP